MMPTGSVPQLAMPLLAGPLGPCSDFLLARTTLARVFPFDQAVTAGPNFQANQRRPSLRRTAPNAPGALHWSGPSHVRPGPPPGGWTCTWMVRHRMGERSLCVPDVGRGENERRKTEKTASQGRENRRRAKATGCFSFSISSPSGLDCGLLVNLTNDHRASTPNSVFRAAWLSVQP